LEISGRATDARERSLAWLMRRQAAGRRMIDRAPGFEVADVANRPKKRHGKRLRSSITTRVNCPMLVSMGLSATISVFLP
jgi:hypothetical protein